MASLEAQLQTATERNVEIFFELAQVRTELFEVSEERERLAAEVSTVNSQLHALQTRSAAAANSTGTFGSSVSSGTYRSGTYRDYDYNAAAADAMHHHAHQHQHQQQQQQQQQQYYFHQQRYY